MQETVNRSFQQDAAERAKYFGGYRELSRVKRIAFKNVSYAEAEKRLVAARNRFEQSNTTEDRLRYFEEWSRARQYTFELLKVAARESDIPLGAATPSTKVAPTDTTLPPPGQKVYQ